MILGSEMIFSSAVTAMNEGKSAVSAALPLRSVIRTTMLTAWTMWFGPTAIHGSGGSPHGRPEQPSGWLVVSSSPAKLPPKTSAAVCPEVTDGLETRGCSEEVPIDEELTGAADTPLGEVEREV